MKGRLGRRADYELYFFIFMLIMVGVVVLTLFNFQKRVAEADLLDQLFLERDLAMLLDVAFAAPGNLWVGYGVGMEKLNFNKFTYRFADNKVAVGTPSTYFYASDQNFDFSTPLEIRQPVRLQLKNDDYKFEIGTNLKSDLRLFKYPIVGTIDSAEKAVVIESNAVREAEENTVKHLAGSFEIKKVLPEYDVYIFVELIPEKKLEALIPGSNALKSRKLASLLLNNIITKKSVKDSAIHLIDDDRLTKALTKAEDAALILRLPADPEFIVPGALEEAIKEYYTKQNE